MILMQSLVKMALMKFAMKTMGLMKMASRPLSPVAA